MKVLLASSLVRSGARFACYSQCLWYGTCDARWLQPLFPKAAYLEGHIVSRAVYYGLHWKCRWSTGAGMIEYVTGHHEDEWIHHRLCICLRQTSLPQPLPLMANWLSRFLRRQAKSLIDASISNVRKILTVEKCRLTCRRRSFLLMQEPTAVGVVFIHQNGWWWHIWSPLAPKFAGGMVVDQFVIASPWNFRVMGIGGYVRTIHIQHVHCDGYLSELRIYTGI